MKPMATPINPTEAASQEQLIKLMQHMRRARCKKLEAERILKAKRWKILHVRHFLKGKLAHA